MGGPRKRFELLYCVSLRQNVELWRIFEEARMIPFFMAMRGHPYNDNITTKFYNAWRGDKVQIGSIGFEMFLWLIAATTGLEYSGLRVSKINNDYYQRFIDSFLKGKRSLGGAKMIMIGNDSRPITRWLVCTSWNINYFGGKVHNNSWVPFSLYFPYS